MSESEDNEFPKEMFVWSPNRNLDHFWTTKYQREEKDQRYIRADIAEQRIAELEAANSTLVAEGLRAQKRGDCHKREAVSNSTRADEIENAFDLCIATLNSWIKKFDPEGEPYTKEGFLPEIPDIKA